ncbi:MAG: trypsin-like serine protease [Planctomycetota bacterium]|nr:trypsin-like serine protease [Planctomycetota bacterium]
MKKIFGVCLAVFLMIAGFMQESKAGLIFGDGAANLALGANFPYVGWVESIDGGNTQFNSSGVLIAPNWVLLSGHQTLAVDSDLNTRHGSLRVGFGSNVFTNRGENQIASEVFLHPAYKDPQIRDGGLNYDLALLYFESPFATIAPVQFYVGGIAVGDSSSIAGYGLFQDVNDPTHSQTLTGNRYAGNNIISSISVPLRPSYVQTYVCTDQFSPECQISPQMGGRVGDSGGPLIINGQVAGVLSRVGGDTNFINFTQYTRLDNDWINSTITSVPEPGSMLLLVVCGSIFMCRRYSQAKHLK